MAELISEKSPEIVAGAVIIGVSALVFNAMADNYKWKVCDPDCRVLNTAELQTRSEELVDKYRNNQLSARDINMMGRIMKARGITINIQGEVTGKKQLDQLDSKFRESVKLEAVKRLLTR